MAGVEVGTGVGIDFACLVASRSLDVVEFVVDFEVEVTLLLSCLEVAEVPDAVSELLLSKTNSLLVCCGITGASEHTLRGLTGVFVEPVALCVDRYESSLLISVMMRWSTPLCCCCSLRVLVVVDVDFSAASPTLPLLSADSMLLISVMVTPGWSLEAVALDVAEDLDVVTVRELAVDELTARWVATCWLALVLELDALYVADFLRVMLPSGLWMTVSPASTSCRPWGARPSLP